MLSNSMKQTKEKFEKNGKKFVLYTADAKDGNGIVVMSLYVDSLMAEFKPIAQYKGFLDDIREKMQAHINGL